MVLLYILKIKDMYEMMQQEIRSLYNYDLLTNEEYTKIYFNN